MERKVNTPVFDVVDSLFMKLGKLNAQRLAKRDECNDILFKRESQSNTIYNEVVKFLNPLMKPQYFMIVFGFVVSLIPMMSVMEFFPPPAAPDGSHDLFPVFLFITIQFGIIWTLSLMLKMVSVRVLFMRNAGKMTMLQLSKIKTFRADHFGFGFRDVYREVTKAREFLIPLNVMVLAYVFMVAYFSNFENMYFIASLIQFAVTQIIVVTMFSWTFLGFTTIAHCDDLGEKEKKTSKEKKESLVPDAV